METNPAPLSGIPLFPKDPMRRLFLPLVVLSLTAFAAGPNKPLKNAAKAIEAAERSARRSPPPCSGLESRFDQLADAVNDARDDDDFDAWTAQRLQQQLSQLSSSAAFSRCGDDVLQQLSRASDALETARAAAWNNRRPPGPPRDDDDDYDFRNRFGFIDTPRVQTAVPFEGELAARVTVPRLTLNNMRGQRFYLGARWRSLGGNWSEWVTTEQWTVPSDPFVWPNAFTHFVHYSALAEEDFAQGRFVVEVSVFDARGREITSRDVPFVVQSRQLLPPPPPPRQPGLVPAPPMPVAVRDCGTGPQDPGCAMQRNGRWAMDAGAWSGVYSSLRNQVNEIVRFDMLKSMLDAQGLTAAQLGLLLDLFANEIYRFDVAKFCAPRVVNPMHALGLSGKFNNSIYQRDYVDLMSKQR